MNINIPIDSLPKTSTITIRRLKSLDIQTYWDLLNYFPSRYEDYSLISEIVKLQLGENVTIIGTIIDSKYQIARTGLKIQKFIIQDDSGKIAVQWYNQPYLLSYLKRGMRVSVTGVVKQIGRQLQLFPKEYERLISNDLSQLKHTGRIIPIYPEKRGLSSKTIREKIWMILSLLVTKERIPEYLPQPILDYNHLCEEHKAYMNIHFPENIQINEQARNRLAFDELFTIQLANQLTRKEWEKENAANPFSVDKYSKNIQQFIDILPFSLTNAQKKVFQEIIADLKKTKPMNRFLQGEVGSGKTVVATLACYLSFLNGYQSLIMAPTEILAMQHYEILTQLFDNHKISVKPAIKLFTGSSKLTAKEMLHTDIIIGTHALIQTKTVFNKVGLVVVDEQHRFGVAQRAELKNKGINPHLLTMTATPIPRTVMLTLYGELDLSFINEMPKGRLSIKTYYIPMEKRYSCYEWIKKQISSFHIQVFIICPLIEESAVESLKSVKAANKEYENLKLNIFNAYKVGLVHGKLKSAEKEKVMSDYKKGIYDVLVATPVVEVGIDIPNASVMIIEGAERFGLAQLHQLRGRIGRGTQQSYCYLFTEKKDIEVIKRLSFFSKTNDGNLLAEKDLVIRGPGNIYGKEQHGYMNLKIASLSDFPMIEKTKNAAVYFLNHLNIAHYPNMEKRIKKYNSVQIAKN